MKIGFGLALLAGVALTVALVLYQGAAEVLGTLAHLGWGLLPLICVHIAQMQCSALGWRPLIAGRPKPPLRALLVIRWIREGTNGLLPVAPIGGDIIGARMLSLRGVRGDVAGASVVLDLTTEVATQLVFTLAGLAWLVRGNVGAPGVIGVALGLAAAAALLSAFVICQRMGVFKLIEAALERLAQKVHWLPLGGVKGLHEAIQAIHRSPLSILRSAGWHLVSWLLGPIEVWLALHFMGIAVDWRAAFILESLGQAARSAGFAVPGAVGVQEGGYMLFGAMLGVPPEAGLALSFAKRLREIVLGLPAVAHWQYIEGRRLFKKRPAITPPAGE